MSKNRILLLTVSAVFVLVITIVVLRSAPVKKTAILPNNTVLSVEIADTNYKRAKGLMRRKTLDQNSGMVFIFDYSAKHLFWMKNTYIPLDIIWLDENYKIVDIKQNVPPCETEQCQTYMPITQAKYVLEVNAGFSNQQNLKIGDEIKITSEEVVANINT